MDSSQLQITHWNCQGFFSKKQEIYQLLNNNDIVILNETLLTDDSSQFA